MLEQNVLRPGIVIGDESLDFLIDAQRGVLAVILVLGDLASEEDLLFLLAEGERPSSRLMPHSHTIRRTARWHARGRCRLRS